MISFNHIYTPFSQFMEQEVLLMKQSNYVSYNNEYTKC